MELNSEAMHSAVFYMTKGRTVGSKDYNLERRGPCTIIGKVSGTTEVIITDRKARKTGSSKKPFFHYSGEFRSGDDATSFVEATILAFDGDQKEDVEKLHGRLNLVSHPCIIRSLGYEVGVGDHEDYIFLALSRFEETFAVYMEKNCKQTMKFGRFTEEFIALIECIILGLLKLHDCGFYCPELCGRHIAVVKDLGKARAMLLDFSLLEKGNKNGKDNDWVSLGYMLKKTAENHGSFGPEIEDLCRNLKNGTLKGTNILKHSALLSVRKKFENVMALSTFVLTNCMQTTELSSAAPTRKLHCRAIDDDFINATEQLHCHSSYKAAEIAFKNLLQCDVGWTANIPSWIKKRLTVLGFNVPEKDTFKDFVWQIRCLIEHENKYLIEVTKKISHRELQFDDEKTDLESEIRKAWPFLFLNCQKFATSLMLKY